MPIDPLFIAAGDLRHSIVIEQPSTTRDQYGQTSQTWSTLLTTRASIRAATQRETLQQDQLSSQVTHAITIRYPGSSITIVPGYRVIFGAQIYTIQAIDNVLLRNRVLRMQCIAIDETA